VWEDCGKWGSRGSVEGDGGIEGERGGRRVSKEIGSVQRGRGRRGRMCEKWREERERVERKESVERGESERPQND